MRCTLLARLLKMYCKSQEIYSRFKGFGEIIVTSKSQSFAYQVLRKHPLALRYSNVFFDQILTRQRTENRDIELVFEGVKTATLKKLAVDIPFL